MKKHKPVNQQVAIVCIVFGIAGGITNFISIYNGKIFTTIMALTPMLLISGISFLIIPGQEPPPGTPEKERVKQWWKSSNLGHRLLWILFGLIGATIGFWLTFTYTDFTA